MTLGVESGSFTGFGFGGGCVYHLPAAKPPRTSMATMPGSTRHSMAQLLGLVRNRMLIADDSWGLQALISNLLMWLFPLSHVLFSLTSPAHSTTLRTGFHSEDLAGVTPWPIHLCIWFSCWKIWRLCEVNTRGSHPKLPGYCQG